MGRIISYMKWKKMFETTNQYILAQTRATTYGIDGAPLQPRHVK